MLEVAPPLEQPGGQWPEQSLERCWGRQSVAEIALDMARASARRAECRMEPLEALFLAPMSSNMPFALA